LISGTSATLKKIADATSLNDCDPDCPEEICQNDASPYTNSSLRDFFTVLALSFHAVFEGLAVGLETESQDVWLLFAGNSIVMMFRLYITVDLWYKRVGHQ
jgi:zinc transporter ZupT